MTTFAFTVSAFFLIYAGFKFQGDDSDKFSKGLAAVSAALIAGCTAPDNATVAVVLFLVFAGITGGRICSGRLVASDFCSDKLAARSGLFHSMIKSTLSTGIFVALAAWLLSVHTKVSIFDLALVAWLSSFAIDFVRRTVFHPDWQVEQPARQARSAAVVFFPEASPPAKSMPTTGTSFALRRSESF